MATDCARRDAGLWRAIRAAWLFPQVTTSELKEHVVQARPLERDVLDANWKRKQLLQTVRRVPSPNRRDRKLPLGFLDDSKVSIESVPLVGRRVFEISFKHEHLISAQSFLQFVQRPFRQQS